VPFHLWVLCLDDLAYEILMKLSLPEVIPISLRDFEERDKELLKIKSSRSQVEYYFTCTPSLPIYIFRNYAETDMITYLDADMFFFSDIFPIYEELRGKSILIVGHRFPKHLRHLEDRGIYNVGLLSFRRDKYALNCLQRWRKQCIEWCYDRVENGLYADQKYLDDWPIRFPGVVELQHKGADLAPWNIMNYSLSLKNGRVLIDKEPLILFHFHYLHKISQWLYSPNLATYGMRATFLIKRYIYAPYIRELYETGRWVHNIIKRTDIRQDSIRNKNPGLLGSNRVFLEAYRKINHSREIIKKLFLGDLWVVIGGRVL